MCTFIALTYIHIGQDERLNYSSRRRMKNTIWPKVIGHFSKKGRGDAIQLFDSLCKNEFSGITRKSSYCKMFNFNDFLTGCETVSI